MAVEIIQPHEISVDNQALRACVSSQIFYLGYGRNAWNATWTNRYYSECVSFDVAELKSHAEKKRVQGNVFKIEALPLLIFQYSNIAVGLFPINDRTGYQYAELNKTIQSAPRLGFWKALPSPKRDWLITAKLPNSIFVSRPFKPASLRSQAIGVNYYLQWNEFPRPSLYPEFLSFAEPLLIQIRKLYLQS